MICPNQYARLTTKYNDIVPYASVHLIVTDVLQSLYSAVCHIELIMFRRRDVWNHNVFSKHKTISCSGRNCPLPRADYLRRVQPTVAILGLRRQTASHNA